MLYLSAPVICLAMIVLMVDIALLISAGFIAKTLKQQDEEREQNPKLLRAHKAITQIAHRVPQYLVRFVTTQLMFTQVLDLTHAG